MKKTQGPGAPEGMERIFVDVEEMLRAKEQTRADIENIESRATVQTDLIPIEHRRFRSFDKARGSRSQTFVPWWSVE